MNQVSCNKQVHAVPCIELVQKGVVSCMKLFATPDLARLARGPTTSVTPWFGLAEAFAHDVDKGGLIVLQKGPFLLQL